MRKTGETRNEKGAKGMMAITLGVILARGGSKGVPAKNLQPLLGKPLVEYTIDAAFAADRIDRLVLSTEDTKIAAIAEARGVEVVMRPKEYATDAAPIDLALRHAVRTVEWGGDEVGIVVGLYGNVPVRKKGTIDAVVEKMASSGADSVETYAPYTVPPQRALRLDGDKPIPLAGVYVPSYRRQQLVPAYHANGAVFALRRDVLMETENVPGETNAYFGTDRRVIVQNPQDAVDVDEPIDLLWAEFLIEKSQRNAGRG